MALLKRKIGKRVTSPDNCKTSHSNHSRILAGVNRTVSIGQLSAIASNVPALTDTAARPGMLSFSDRSGYTHRPPVLRAEALEPPAAAPQCSDFSEIVIQGSPARQGPRGTESRCTEWTDCRSAMSSARYLPTARQIDRPCGHLRIRRVQRPEHQWQPFQLARPRQPKQQDCVSFV